MEECVEGIGEGARDRGRGKGHDLDLYPKRLLVGRKIVKGRYCQEKGVSFIDPRTNPWYN